MGVRTFFANNRLYIFLNNRIIFLLDFSSWQNKFVQLAGPEEEKQNKQLILILLGLQVGLLILIPWMIS